MLLYKKMLLMTFGTTYVRVLSLKPAIWTLELNSLLLCYFIYWLCKCSAFHRDIILLRMTKPLKTIYPLNHCVYLYGIPILCAIYLD